MNNPILRISFFGPSGFLTDESDDCKYYRDVLKGLANLGHEITIFEQEPFLTTPTSPLTAPAWAERITYDCEFTNGVMTALATARGFDVIIKASQVGVHDDLLESAVLDLKSDGCIIVFWDGDVPATLDRLTASTSDPFLKLIAGYDLILTGSKLTAHAGKFLGLGAKRYLSVASGQSGKLSLYLQSIRQTMNI